MTTYRNYETVRKRYSEEEAIASEEKKLATYLETLEKKGITILDKKVTIQVKGALCLAEGSIETRRMEKRHQKIEEG